MPVTKLGSYQIEFANSEEYHRLKQEIFTQDQYYFETDVPTPLIIDAGAHIGLATLYFKKIYPAANVIAIEPQLANFELLEINVQQNRLENVQLISAALDTKAGQATFYSDASATRWFSTAGFSAQAWNGQQTTTQAATVPTLPLSDFLVQPVDFLKMDIEGAEQAVLMATGSRLTQIKHLIVEFHPVAHQSLLTLIDFLERQGFDVELWKDGQAVSLKKATGLVLLEAQLSSPRK